MKYLKTMLSLLLTSTICCATLAACTAPTEVPTDGTAETVTEDATVQKTEESTDDEETETDPLPAISFVSYPAATLPDFSQYTNESRIAEKLGGDTLSFVIEAEKYYKNGVLTACDKALTKQEDGSLRINGAVFSELTGGSVQDCSPEDAAKAIGMKVAVYDQKLVLFYKDEAPLDTYDDLYTFEAMYLYMTGADEADILNAFIDLPDLVTNGSSNTTYYTASDLNLGVQTSVYYAQMGQQSDVNVGPRIVAGEGKSENNHTTVRIYNEQQTCISQFLAFGAEVKGGVQVAALGVGNETLIATAPFAKYTGSLGDIRVFDCYGLLRTVVNLRDIIDGPYTIVTGHFSDKTEDEVLLVAAQTLNENNELRYAIVSLANGGEVLAQYALDCTFASVEKNAPVQLSVRNNKEGKDSLILYFPSRQSVYEGDAETAKFENAGIILPEDAIGVSASNQFGEKYVVSLPAREDSENQSFMVVYDTDAKDGETLDVGFRENRFFSDQYTDGYNDDKYVSEGDFCHLRIDFGAMSPSGSATPAQFRAQMEARAYADWRSTVQNAPIGRLANEYLFLEPCFSHRWNKITGTRLLSEYVEPETGVQRYISIGKSGEYVDYNELSSSYYTGTYADGILELAKVRIYPLRFFLQETATAFRGEGANPEHLVGMSPVHEHEINVSGSVGDYNAYMIEGFRSHLMDLYGSLEAINTTFGTPFKTAEEIDPPRDGNRGAWDKYSGAYFTEWAMYNRYIVNKRIMEAYREALLAGYPPESISAHQIPEGEAVSGFLGDADTRLTPVDVAVTCGTSYGGTRYGSIYKDKNNFIALANLSGHWNISIGEYGTLSADRRITTKQMQWLWENGVRMVHHINPGNVDGRDEAEKAAVQKLAEQNLPRPGYAGGTTGAIGIGEGEDGYRIVQLGEGSDSDSVGLLKSIDENGKWEGTVYLVPFHAAMQITALEAIGTPISGSENVFSTGKLEAVKNADQVEVVFAAKAVGEAHVTIEVYHAGNLLESSVVTYKLTETMTNYRYVLSNQLYEDELEVVLTFHGSKEGTMTGIEVETLNAYLETESVGFLYYDGGKAYRKSAAHEGGVTFDILDRDMKN